MLQQKRRNAKTYMTDDSGRELSRDEAINALMDELAKGREVIPMSPDCGKPCAYASCPGFDYGERGGCGGHDTGEEPRKSSGSANAESTAPADPENLALKREEAYWASEMLEGGAV
jgi:hypothetical protein